MARNRFPRVEVEWLDATTEYHQLTIVEALRRCQLDRRLSLGYLVKDDAEAIVLMQTSDPPEQDGDEEGGADFTTIPRGWVKRLTYLRPGPPPTPGKDDEE